MAPHAFLVSMTTLCYAGTKKNFVGEAMSDPSHDKDGRNRRGVWSLWLLLILLPLTMWVPLYNRVEPTFAGFPFFYWFQLLTIIIGAGLAALAYFVTNDD
jgi:ABC-type microcin C transport system permease subunit YejE